jgi:hypothetical protein
MARCMRETNGDEQACTEAWDESQGEGTTGESSDEARSEQWKPGALGAVFHQSMIRVRRWRRRSSLLPVAVVPVS